MLFFNFSFQANEFLFQLREVPAHHATEGGVDKKVRGISIKSQVTFPPHPAWDGGVRRRSSVR